MVGVKLTFKFKFTLRFIVMVMVMDTFKVIVMVRVITRANLSKSMFVVLLA